MKRRFAFAAVLAVLILGLTWWTVRKNASCGPGSPAALRSSTQANSPAANPNPASPYANEEPSHLADRLNAPDSDIAADLRVLNDVFVQFRSATHGGNPIGENSEITAALTGRNRLDFAFIPKGNPAINARGELCDRWGTPFFFHQLSGTQMEIRSAGPDRLMWTKDDTVLTPGLHPPPL